MSCLLKKLFIDVRVFLLSLLKWSPELVNHAWVKVFRIMTAFRFFSNCVPQHILPMLLLYNAQWWGYESLTAIVLVYI